MSWGAQTTLADTGREEQYSLDIFLHVFVATIVSPPSLEGAGDARRLQSASTPLHASYRQVF